MECTLSPWVPNGRHNLVRGSSRLVNLVVSAAWCQIGYLVIWASWRTWSRRVRSGGIYDNMGHHGQWSGWWLVLRKSFRGGGWSNSSHVHSLLCCLVLGYKPKLCAQRNEVPVQEVGTSQLSQVERLCEGFLVTSQMQPRDDDPLFYLSTQIFMHRRDKRDGIVSGVWYKHVKDGAWGAGRRNSRRCSRLLPKTRKRHLLFESNVENLAPSLPCRIRGTQLRRGYEQIQDSGWRIFRG